ncbi:hypothetical protein SARC_14979 [Sphaeroforma arctica JP610]|uniref:Uncharacterized protein n=1 Tax=Sphaeroforma arctica JP610 TaxID=667725 RepID=A0A0L0F8M0_9EUKA|nr:hypothetical protein SARC_14979 [Sphaeroforma arctica JP610]KNC72463.1 hypothetical protein SARC_14979 [Sphaeroforma arctica JP610]|eukprot:XP_014146365.1 hypothetical protein SARC_14979 [Sphaeroforma arctica JP610]
MEKEGDTISDKKKEIALKIRGTEAVKRYFGVQNERKDFAKIEHLLSPVVREKEEAMFKEVDEEMEAIQLIAGEMKPGWNKTFLQECADALGQQRRTESKGGHSHDGKPCHGHGPPTEEDHGHSHGNGAPEHGHSHDGKPCHGHGPPKPPQGVQGGPPQNPGEVGQISLAISVPQATHTAGQNPLDGDPNEVLTVQRMITTPDGKKPLGSPKAIPRKNLRELLQNMKATMKK